MYLRTTKVKRPDGRVDEYIRLVESYWNDGSPRHRVVCNLGRKDLLAPHADALLHMLKGEPHVSTQAQEADALGAWDWGPMLVARHLWQELGVQAQLDSLARRSGDRGELADRALALVTNRLCHPTSEHGMARWLETDYVCGRSGERWLPEWRDDTERLASKRPRVRVKDRQLRQWYGTLDRLLPHKQQIEKGLFLELRNLFSLKVDLVFYDLTSTYFEGHGPEGLAKHGHSRDGKPRNRQIVVGLVMIDGWPIAHHVFEGNKRDATTVESVLKDLEQRFGLRRVVFVGDRGMVTSANIDLLRSRTQGYLVGLNRRRRPQVQRYVKQATGTWMECPPGITASEKAEVPKTLVQEVASDSPAVQVYKELCEVERAFSELKDVIEMRPIYHQRPRRVQAHVFVASLTFLLDRALEKKLKSARMDISSKEAWQILKTVRVVEIKLENGKRKRSVTQGSARAARIVRALGINNLDPDASKAREKTA